MANGPMVYYLKYRPQTLSELIGQEAVKKTLLSSFQNNKLAHAYLFVGPRGTGKTSTARILAKMVNCEKSSVVSRQSSDNSESLKADSEAILKTDSYPCNKCSTCLSITDGSNLDLIEIDAASNRGIEDIRSLRDKIKLSPSSAKKKVYIIDEVHMLTTEAFNALLKTLEEPPSHALFILATTEGAKIPQTILSRVQKLDFKLASSEELFTALERIVNEEKIDIDKEALKLLIKKSDGSFRDGVKLLDQTASLGEKITVKLIEESFKSGQFEDILDLIKNLKDKNTTAGLLSVGKQIEKGVDAKQFILSLMDTFRSLALIKNGAGEQLVKASLTEDKYQVLVEISQGFANKDLISCLSFLQTALEKLKFTSIPSLPLELAIVEICSSSPVILNAPPRSGKYPWGEVKDLPRDASKKLAPLWCMRGSNELRDSSLIAQNDKGVVQNDKQETVDDGGLKVVVEDSPDILKLKEKWTFVLETIRPVNFSLEALLRAINILDCTNASVVIEVPYSFHQRILEAPKNRDLLEGILSDILGRSIRVSTVLGSRPTRREDIANIEIAQDDEIIRAAAEIFNSDTVN